MNKKKEIDESRIPAEVLALIKKKAANKPEPVNNTKLVNDFRADGGKIIHIRPHRFLDFDNERLSVSKGLTVAFKVKGSRCELASAVQHSVDTFSKKLGTKTAISHFQEGKTITLPINKDYPTEHMIRAMQSLT